METAVPKKLAPAEHRVGFHRAGIHDIAAEWGMAGLDRKTIRECARNPVDTAHPVSHEALEISSTMMRCQSFWPSNVNVQRDALLGKRRS